MKRKGKGSGKETLHPATTTPTARGEEAVEGQGLSQCVRPKPREREPTETPIPKFCKFLKVFKLNRAWSNYFNC